MRILLISPLFPPYAGGAATYSQTLCKHLVNAPDITKLLLLTEQHPEFPAVASSQGDKLLVRRTISRRISHPENNRFMDILRYFSQQIWFFHHLNGIIADFQPDLIHYHARYRGPLFHSALKRADLPILADLRDLLTNPIGLERVADLLLTASENTARFAVAAGFPKTRIVTIPTPIDVFGQELETDRAFTSQDANFPSPPFLMYAGDISVQKGIPELLEAFRSFREIQPGVKLLIIGTNRMPSDLQKLIDDDEGVFWHPPVPQPVLFQLVKQAEVVVLPSKSEALPRIILESIALKTRVIAPPNVPEFDRHIPQFVLSEITPEEIIRKLRQVLSSNRLPYYPLSQHDPQNGASQTIALYEKVREGHGSFRNQSGS